MAANYGPVRRARNHTEATRYSSSMEILFDTEYKCLVMRYALDFVTPLPCNFDRRLHGFGPCVHWQHHVKTKHPRDQLCESWKDVIVKGSAAEG
jgi:hypothetical protein